MILNKQDVKQSVGCVILTYQAKAHLKKCLTPLLNSPLRPRILVVDSSSTDGTVDMAEDLGVETKVIPQSAFNHGTTREMARQFLNTDIVCMLTQDAYLSDSEALSHLIAPLVTSQAAIAYAKQIPHPGASFFEAFHRAYNYPNQSQLRSIHDTRQYGVYTFFCSDSCAAYSNAALNEIGGFEEVLLGEDTVATAKILRNGHKIAYVAESIVYHSHRYSLWQEFCRSFDTGLARERYASLIRCEGGDRQRGVDYIKTMFSKLIKEKPWLFPYAVAYTAAKWSGYQIGKRSISAPIAFKHALSSQKFYWKR
jgi:rhamnosyltransferase